MNSAPLPERRITASRSREVAHSRSVFRERVSILVVRNLRIALPPAQDKAAVKAYTVPIILSLLTTYFVEICLRISLPFSGSGIFYRK